MAKSNTIFCCTQCGYESGGWLGKCPSCSSWGSIVEESRAASKSSQSNSQGDALSEGRWAKRMSRLSFKDSGNNNSGDIADLSGAELPEEQRTSTGVREMDRVLGGGIVKGSMVLIGGDPGIGKSTLLLQLCKSINSDSAILYVSGEESTPQILMRASRLKVQNPKVKVISETDIEKIAGLMEKFSPGMVVIDSIQTMYDPTLSSAPGSVSQVREVTAGLMRIAKMTGITILLVGHVTKDGAIAGPRVLEHMVDTVLYFEGERHMSFRILRSVKNRFGSTNEIGVFEMTDEGLKEVENPSAVMISGSTGKVSGSVVVATVEGTRPMLAEVQALVCPSAFGMPRRTSDGFDVNRLNLLIAVLERRAGIRLHNFDTYVNVVGGIKLGEPSCDLGVVVAVASAFRDIPITPGTVIIGEMGLSGEIRRARNLKQRIVEAERLGFERCIIPESGAKEILKTETASNRIKISVIGAINLAQALKMAFESE